MSLLSVQGWNNLFAEQAYASFGFKSMRRSEFDSPGSSIEEPIGEGDHVIGITSQSEAI
jgi:hypothetical protein